MTGNDAVFGIPGGTDTADQVSLLEPNSTSVEQTKTMRPTGIVPASLSRPKYSNKVPTKDRQTNYSEVLVDIEKKRLEVQENQLAVEERRCEIEAKRLVIEEQRFQVELKRYELDYQKCSK